MGRMVRTNIVIDERLVRRVMRRYSLTSKREAVDFALRRVAGEDLASRLGDLEGAGWEGDLATMRDGDPDPP